MELLDAIRAIDANAPAAILVEKFVQMHPGCCGALKYRVVDSATGLDHRENHSSLGTDTLRRDAI